METTTHVWNASDLARERTTILSDALQHPVLVRATGGELLMVITADRVRSLEGVLHIAQVLTSAMALTAADPSPTSLGELAFAVDWDIERRTRFASDLREVAAHALSTRNSDEVDVFIEASRPRPAIGVIDPARIRILLGA
jgi:hypothetical protein